MRYVVTHPVEGGSANDYDYAAGDPVNKFDLDGNACIFSNSKGCLDGRGQAAVATTSA